MHGFVKKHLDAIFCTSTSSHMILVTTAIMADLQRYMHDRMLDLFVKVKFFFLVEFLISRLASLFTFVFNQCACKEPLSLTHCPPPKFEA